MLDNQEGLEVQEKTKQAIQAILDCLNGFTDWQKSHILTCAWEQISEPKLPSLLEEI